MGVVELVLLSIGLAMDAFAVSICKGISIKKMSFKKASIIGLWFGGFQALMPIIGYFLGTTFESFLTSVDHWIAFVLLVFIGGKMIKDAFDKKTEECSDDISFKIMLVLAIATSIDALAVGITFAFLNVNLIFAITLIGITSFVLSFFGAKIGNRFGSKYEKKAEFIGGFILILLGLKILLEHLGIISF
ncbi:MAG: manganese efflux pump [Clostridia bacterium]|jgi:putative Mn2+ efflux pump MntP|nr:manganese efflux pump [Clostridia bacterium]